MPHEPVPAFQFYPKDFLADGKQAAMSLAECGAYIRLLSICWLEHSIPDNVPRVARMVGTTPLIMQKLWPAVRACFTPSGEGRLIHARLEKERRKQAAFRELQRQKGLAGAARRWDDAAATSSPEDGRGHAPAIAGRWPDDSRADGQPIAEPMAERWPSDGSPISDLRSPSPSPDTGGVRAAALGVPVPPETADKAAPQTAPSHTPSDNPDDNVEVITALVLKEILPLNLPEAELAEAVKDRCAYLEIAYNSTVVRKAIESAQFRRHLKTPLFAPPSGVPKRAPRRRV